MSEENTTGPAAALYGFMGWLTSRDEESGPFSGWGGGAQQAAVLVKAFCESQGFAPPPDDFHKHLKPYPAHRV